MAKESLTYQSDETQRLNPVNRTSTSNPETTLSLARILELLPVACRVVNAEQSIIWYSREYKELFDASDHESCCESLGLRHHDVDCQTFRTIRSGVSQTCIRWLGWKCFSIETFPLKDPEGNVIASFELLRDITIIKNLESALISQQDLLETANKSMIELNHDLENARNDLEKKNECLEDANRELRSLDKLKDEFISIASHELKAPLTSIKGSIDLFMMMNTRSLEAANLDLLKIAQRNIDRLASLIKDLLDIARIESGRLSLDPEEFAVEDMIQDCLVSQRQLAEQKNIELRAEIPQGLRMEADHNRLIQVVVNLMNNAIKFTDQGSVSVSVVEEPGLIRFKVSDTGIGIPQDALETIFDKFSQVGSALHRNSGGTGLGLAIVRGIINEHGGDIRATSEANRGSCFTFTIPQPLRRP